MENTSNKALVYRAQFLTNDTNSFSIKDYNNLITVSNTILVTCLLSQSLSLYFSYNIMNLSYDIRISLGSVYEWLSSLYTNRVTQCTYIYILHKKFVHVTKLESWAP